MLGLQVVHHWQEWPESYEMGEGPESCKMREGPEGYEMCLYHELDCWVDCRSEMVGFQDHSAACRTEMVRGERKCHTNLCAT